MSCHLGAKFICIPAIFVFWIENRYKGGAVSLTTIEHYPDDYPEDSVTQKEVWMSIPSPNLAFKKKQTSLHGLPWRKRSK